MLGLVPAVRSYFWIFNRCPIIPMGLTKQKTHRNAADGSSCPLPQTDVAMEGFMYFLPGNVQ